MIAVLTEENLFESASAFELSFILFFFNVRKKGNRTYGGWDFDV